MAAPRPDLMRGALAGLAAGLAAAFAMNQFQKLWSAFVSEDSEGDGDSATVRTADEVSHALTGRKLPKRAKEPAGEAVHYALGAALGVAYGVAAEFRPRVTLGFGTVFGTTTALVLDEALVPALGITDPPWEFPAGTHAYSLVSHLVFGAVAEGTRASIRALA